MSLEFLPEPLRRFNQNNMDTYFDQLRAIDRLYKEYLKHKSLLIAVDFDDTVFDFHDEGTNHRLVLELLKECGELGFYITIYTASTPDRYNFMREYFAKDGIPVHSINKNPIENLPYGHHGKIYYNIFLDDRAGLYSAYIVLRETVDKIKNK